MSRLQSGGDCAVQAAGPRRVSVLMYHAVTGPAAADDGADAHYAVTTDAFERHLRAARDAGLPPRSVASLLDGGPGSAGGRHALAFTFDDGHVSHAAAAERLAREGGSADFFVNPGLVGSRGLLDWGALRAMAQAGQSIQSHGWTHAYLDTMTPAQVRESLHRSKAVIEDRLGRPVTLFAPAGGKRAPGLEAIAAALGYRAVCDSRAGTWRLDRGAPGDGAAALAVPRLAIRASTAEATVAAWMRGERLPVWREQARERVLTGARRLLGPGRYEAARARLLAGRTAAAADRVGEDRA